jgi:predicted site-specific integrase-resolvase
MKTTDEYLLVNQTAELLGVSANTVRAWAFTGKFQEYRHLVNKCRLFRKVDVEALLQQFENRNPEVLAIRKAK